MSTLLIANNCTRESGSFMGDQVCAIKAAYLFVQNQLDVDKVIMSVSPGNEMHFLWEKFIDDPRGDGSVPKVELIYDQWHPGDWGSRFSGWDKWRADRNIEGQSFLHYRELYLRIHGAQRQMTLCGIERGLGRRNIFEYWFYGQENLPEECVGADWFDDTLIYHPPLNPERDVYVSPLCKTQGNITFTFDYWSEVVHRLVEAGVTVTVGYDGPFCEDLCNNPLYYRHWGDHKQWFEQVCHHKIVACGNTGTGWVAAACGVPLFTMEPLNSQMPDHRYRQCGLKNIVEVLDTPDADYCTRRLIEEVKRAVVMTTGCYDVLHAGHVRHLERSRALGSKLIVALNSDESIRRLKGPTRPINPCNQRKAILEALRCVDEVRVFEGDVFPLIEEVKPSIFTNGYGYTPSSVVGRELMESLGVKVVITCADDAKDEPSTTKIVRRAKLIRSGDTIAICHAGSAYSVNPFDKLKLMADEFLKVCDLPGDVADLGAWRGGTSLILSRLAPHKTIHLFDTWEGTPHDDELCHHKKGEWAASMEDCISLVGHSSVQYHKGVFPFSAMKLLSTSANIDDITSFCFVYVDMDTYQSTKAAIEFFLPRLQPGGVLFFDDYGWTPCAGVKKAVDEMFPPEEYDRYATLAGVPKRRVVTSNYACIVEKR